MTKEKRIRHHKNKLLDPDIYDSEAIKKMAQKIAIEIENKILKSVMDENDKC